MINKENTLTKLRAVVDRARASLARAEASQAEAEAVAREAVDCYWFAFNVNATHANRGSFIELRETDEAAAARRCFNIASEDRNKAEAVANLRANVTRRKFAEYERALAALLDAELS